MSSIVRCFDQEFCWEILWIRFRAVSTFGQSTIRRFAANVADMKKLAARDFEDILQVNLWFIKYPSIWRLWLILSSVLDSMLWGSLSARVWRSNHETPLFSCGMARSGKTPHAYNYLPCSTWPDNHLIWHRNEIFQEECVSPFWDCRNTIGGHKEIPKESRRCMLQWFWISACSLTWFQVSKGTHATINSSSTPAAKGQRPKTMNVRTHKYHAMGDYEPTIPEFGTTDGISSQIVSDLITTQFDAYFRAFHRVN